MNPVSCQRLHNQHISNQVFTQPEDLVHYMGAIQAQDYAMAKWAVGTRMPNTTDDLIEQALSDGRILRTHILRPTWHLVAASDIRWMLDLTAPHVARASVAMERQLGLDASTLKNSNIIIEKALQDHGCLTRDELMQVLLGKGFDIALNRPAHYMFAAELSGLVCSGPRKGNQISYMLLGERVPKGMQRTREEGLSELAFRYFRSHGPATIKDFAWWSGLNQTDVKKGIAGCGNRLMREKIDEKEYWMANSTSILPSETIHVLPAYDEFMVSYSDRSASIHPEYVKATILSNGIFKPVIVSSGQVIGTWKRTVKPKEIVINLELLQPPGVSKLTSIKEAFIGYASFMQKPLVFE